MKNSLSAGARPLGALLEAADDGFVNRPHPRQPRCLLVTPHLETGFDLYRKRGLMMHRKRGLIYSLMTMSFTMLQKVGVCPGQ